MNKTDKIIVLSPFYPLFSVKHQGLFILPLHYCLHFLLLSSFFLLLPPAYLSQTVARVSDPFQSPCPVMPLFPSILHFAAGDLTDKSKRILPNQHASS